MGAVFISKGAPAFGEENKLEQVHPYNGEGTLHQGTHVPCVGMVMNLQLQSNIVKATPIKTKKQKTNNPMQNTKKKAPQTTIIVTSSS